MTVIPATFAESKGEKQQTVNGVGVLTQNADGTKALSVQTKDGKLIQVVIASADLDRLQIRDKEQIKVNGVYLKGTKDAPIQEKIFARTLTRSGKAIKLQEPVQLSDQEKAQVKASEDEQESSGKQGGTKTCKGSAGGKK